MPIATRLVRRLQFSRLVAPPLTPWEFATDQMQLIRERWNAVRDTQPEGVHEARVALRRLRAALEIMEDRRSAPVKLCRQLGRSLGRVRELDVSDGYLAELAERVPSAACAVASVRRNVGNDRHRAARELVKALDEIKLRPLARLRRHAPPALAFWKDWRADLVDVMRTRTDALASAVHDAPAVYMPNRLHRVRIALKKFRYSLELIDATLATVDARLMRDIRKTQDSLGRLHDQHVAQRTVRCFDDPGKGLAGEMQMLDAVIEAERTARYAKYLEKPDRLRAFCEYGAMLARRQWPRAARLAVRALPAAGLVAMPVVLWRSASTT